MAFKHWIAGALVASALVTSSCRRAALAAGADLAAHLRFRERRDQRARPGAVQLQARRAAGSRLRQHVVSDRASARHADVRRRRRAGQPLQGRRQPGRRRRRDGDEAAVAAARGRGLRAARHHLLRAVALPLRPHGQRQRVRERDLDRAESRARLHVRRQPAGNHSARDVRGAAQRRHQDSRTTKTSTCSATAPSS